MISKEVVLIFLMQGYHSASLAIKTPLILSVTLPFLLSLWPRMKNLRAVR